MRQLDVPARHGCLLEEGEQAEDKVVTLVDGCATVQPAVGGEKERLLLINGADPDPGWTVGPAQVAFPQITAENSTVMCMQKSSSFEWLLIQDCLPRANSQSSIFCCFFGFFVLSD